MAFDIRCKNCGQNETTHEIGEADCEEWEPERELTEEERQELEATYSPDWG